MNNRAAADHPDASSSRLASAAWAVLMVVPAPLLIAFYLHAAEPIPRMLTALGAFIGAAFGIALWYRGLLTTGRGRLAAAVLICSGLTVGSAIVWNDAYLKYALTVPRQEIFRRALYRYTTPAYGLPDLSPLARAWPVLLLGLAAAGWVLWARFDKPVTKLRLLAIMAVMVVSMFVFARSEPAEGSERRVMQMQRERKKAKAAGATTRPVVYPRRDGYAFGFINFREDAAKFSGPLDLMRRYVQEMPTLSWFGQHYPPGSAMLFWFDAKAQKTYAGLHKSLLGRPTRKKLPVAMTIIAIFTAAAVIPICASAKELLPGRPRVHHYAALCYAAAAGPLIFASLSTTPMILLPAAGAVWAALRGARTGHWSAAVVLGLCMPLFSLISFSAAYFAVALAACFALCCVFRLWPLKNLMKTALLSAVVAIAFVGVLRVVGFDLFACARIGLQQHHAQASTGGFDALGLYFMRLTGNTLAFLLMNLPLCGLATATLLMWRSGDWRKRRYVLLPAALVGIAVAALSGSFFLETERIWVFFLPLLAVAAAVELGRRGNDAWTPRWAIVMMIAFAVVQELCYVHYIS